MVKYNCIVVALAFLLASCATAQSVALHFGMESYKKRDYEGCLVELGRADGYGKHSEATSAQISFYRGLCLEGAGRSAEAVAVYQNLIRNYPNTDWAAQAKARMAGARRDDSRI